MAEALARNTDPITSHLAADKIERSGRAANHRQQCLDVVRDEPGHTAAEIGEKTGLGQHEANRRLADLERDGLVRKGKKVECTVRCSWCVTWESTGKLF